MTRNTLLVAAILVALGLGAGLWLVLTPSDDASPPMAGSPRPEAKDTEQVATGDAGNATGETVTKKPVSGEGTTGAEQPDQQGEDSSDDGDAAEREPVQLAPAPAPATGETAAAEAAPVPPTFDIVRVERDGSAVIAGRAEPGATVHVFDGEQVIAETEAGSDGSFALLLDEPLPEGARRLSLAVLAEDGTVVPSEDEVVVVVAALEQPAESASAAASAAQESAEAAVAAVDAATEITTESGAQTAESSADATQETTTTSGTATVTPEAGAATGATGSEQTTATAQAETAEPATQPAGSASSATAPAETASTDGDAATTTGESVSAEQPAEQQMADTPSLATALAAEQPVASASTSAAPAPQVAAAEATVPLVVMQPKSGEGASQVLQGPTAAGEKPTLSIEAVDYDLTGQVVISGRGPGGAQVLLYLDQAVLGQATVDGEGRWQFRPEANVAAGLHRLRADLVGADGAVAARAEIPFQRAAPIQVAADEEFIVVQPGHSLWVIARKRYGEGVQYTAIYEANEGQIRNPDLIYPGQIFLMPTVN